MRGADTPDVFRAIPTKQDHSPHTIGAAKNLITRRVMFASLCAALFGYESAVYPFGRWSVSLEAAGLRIAQLQWSMYVGDEGLIDIVAKESDQARTGKMSRLMGAELSAKKRHLMASIGEVFWGLHEICSARYRSSL